MAEYSPSARKQISECSGLHWDCRFIATDHRGHSDLFSSLGLFEGEEYRAVAANAEADSRPDTGISDASISEN